MSDYSDFSEPGDDFQVMDLVPFSAASVGSVAADILFEGSATCVCPDNYTMVAQVVNLANNSATAIEATLSILSGSTRVPLLEVVLAANTAVGGNEIVGPNSAFRLIAPPTWKFQASSNSAGALDVQMLVRLVFGAGL